MKVESEPRYARLPDGRKLKIAPQGPKYAKGYVLTPDGGKLTLTEWYATWTLADWRWNLHGNLRDLHHMVMQEHRAKLKKKTARGFSDVVLDPWEINLINEIAALRRVRLAKGEIKGY